RALLMLRNGPDLAEDASEMAQAEEDRPRSAPAPQTIFFTEMSERARDDGVPAGVARASLVRQPVHAAIPRADAAIGELRERGLDAAGDLGRIETQICGFEIGHGFARLSAGSASSCRFKTPRL